MAGRTTVKAKVVLLGEGAVGKTSLVLRYVDNKFNDKHVQTLQVGSLYGCVWCYEGGFSCLYFQVPLF